MLAQIGADLVEGPGGDLGAVAQPRHQLAVIDDEPPEGGFGRLRRAAIIPDLTENLVRGSRGGAILVLPVPHVGLLRFCPLCYSRDSRQVASTTNGVGKDYGRLPTG